MKLWPSRSSTVVEASRTVSAGTEMPAAIATEWVGSSWLTFGLMTRLMMPSRSTVGVKARPTPYFLYSTVIAPSEPGTGMGYSPPARKLAVSPDSATRLGCARLRMRPFCSSALSSTSSGLAPPTSRWGVGPAGRNSRLLERAARRGQRQLRRRNLVADIGKHAAAEHVPLHAKLAARLARGF